MNAIPDVVLLGCLSRETQLHGLHAQAPPAGAAIPALPRLPADLLHVAACLNGAADPIQPEFEGLHAQTASGCSRNDSVAYPVLPANLLHVAMVLNVGHVGVLGPQTHLQRLDAQPPSVGAGNPAVLYPRLPANLLHVAAIPDVVLLGGLSGEAQLHGLNAQPPSAGATVSVFPRLPADPLHVAACLDAATHAGKT